jgi:hypothetical protein
MDYINVGNFLQNLPKYLHPIHFTMKNGSIKTNFDVYADDKYSKEIYDHLIKCTRNIFRKLSGVKYKGHEYEGFPSPLHLTKQVYFFAESDRNSARMSVVKVSEDNIPDDEKQYPIIIFINLYEFDDKELKQFSAILTHELYHILAKEHEGEDILIKEIEKEMSPLLNKMKSIENLERTEIVSEYMLLRKLNTHAYLNEASTVQLFEEIMKFATEHEKKVNEHIIGDMINYIADLGLNYIAIKLFDRAVMQMHLSRYSISVLNLRDAIKAIEEYADVIRKNEKNKIVKDTLLSRVKLIEWQCFLSWFPFHGIVYYLIKNPYKNPEMNSIFMTHYHNVGKALIERYKDIILLADPETRPYVREYIHFFSSMCEHQIKSLRELSAPKELYEVHNSWAINWSRKLIKHIVDVTYILQNEYDKNVMNLRKNYLKGEKKEHPLLGHTWSYKNSTLFK